MSGNLLTVGPRLYEARFPDAGRLAGCWAEDCPRRHGTGARALDMGGLTRRDAAHPHAPGRTATRADLSEVTRAPARARYLAFRRRPLALGGPCVAETRDGARFLGRTRVRTTDGAAPPGARHSARLICAAHGFEVPDLHDDPGPRTEPPWQQGESPGTTAGGYRPHLVAHPHPTR